jgi:hypothetical protein
MPQERNPAQRSRWTNGGRSIGPRREMPPLARWPFHVLVRKGGFGTATPAWYRPITTCAVLLRVSREWALSLSHLVPPGFGEFVSFWLADEPRNHARPEDRWHPDPHDDIRQTDRPIGLVVGCVAYEFLNVSEAVRPMRKQRQLQSLLGAIHRCVIRRSSPLARRIGSVPRVE